MTSQPDTPRDPPSRRGIRAVKRLKVSTRYSSDLDMTRIGSDEHIPHTVVTALGRIAGVQQIRYAAGTTYMVIVMCDDWSHCRKPVLELLVNSLGVRSGCRKWQVRERLVDTVSFNLSEGPAIFH